MKTRSKHILFFLAAIIFITGCARPSPSLVSAGPYDSPLPPFSTPVTCEEVRLAFYKYSAPAIVKKLLENEYANWNMIMKKVGAGDADWINHASIYIRPGMDAGGTGEFTDALALALQHNPEVVLSLEQGPGLSMLDVCSWPFIEPEYDFVKSHGKKALAALHKVDKPYLQESRDTCIRRLEDALAFLEKEYREGRW